ncbi:MAG: ribose-phosphate pyrophosphokinase [Clostridia bacterium]|nr:ribose-phosphate pyrophosphokinase [Clostridia bacterium]
MKDIAIFACRSAEEFTKEICDDLGVPMGQIDSFKFANDNNFVQLKESVRGKDVYLVQTTHPPVNERVMELLITIDAAKRAGAKKITAVLPYYIYSRSDKKDQSRIPVTAKLMANLLEAAGVNHVLTCDLHNSAIQAYFNVLCDRVTGAYLLEEYFKAKNLKDIVVIATDAGSSKKAYKYSKYFDCPMALIDKQRATNNDTVVATNIIGDVKGKTALIFDDEISTAGTLVEAASIVHKHGAKEIYAGASHGIFDGNAIEKIRNSVINEVVVTNTVPVLEEKRIDKIKVVSIAPLFADAIKRLNEEKPLGDLFIYEK